MFQCEIQKLKINIFIRFSITLTFLVVYLQGAEIFPTQLRYTGSGFASTMGAIAGIFAPIIAQLVNSQILLR